MSGVLSIHQVRATVYRRNAEPFVFGMASNRASNSYRDIIELSIERRINQPAAVSLVLPGRSGTGSAPRWDDLINPGDWLQVDATVKRNPDSLSDPWRTVFFGYIDSLTEDFNVSRDVEDISSISATCQLGFLETNFSNYWINFNTQAQLEQRTGLSTDTSTTTQTAGSTAMLLDEIFQKRLYTMLRGDRRIPGLGDVRWRDTHGYRFESDPFMQTFQTTQFAPHASSWLQAVQEIVDVPAFYQMYCDVVPQARITTGAGVSELSRTSERVTKKSSGLVFPDSGALLTGNPSATSTKIGSRVDAIIIRPLPFPEYHENGGYDSLAWDRLPTIAAREELGEISRTLARSRKSIFTYYMTSMIDGIGAVSDTTKAQEQAQVLKNIVDVDKYVHTYGFQLCAASTRRSSGIGDLNTNGPSRFGPTTTDINSFLAILNEQLFSYYQFADRFKTGAITTPLDLRLELGSRYLFDKLSRLGFVDGYRHTFTSTEASTTINLTRVLPLSVYQGEYRQTLGRKRLDEVESPLKATSQSFGTVKDAAR